MLVVEDEETVRSMLRSLLETHHYHILVAQNGAEALNQYRQHQSEIQLVMTDLMMPIMDGFALIENLKAIHSELLIIALSDVTTHKKNTLAAGADAFLAKPFDLETLLNDISALLHTGAP